MHHRVSCVSAVLLLTLSGCVKHHVIPSAKTNVAAQSSLFLPTVALPMAPAVDAAAVTAMQASVPSPVLSEAPNPGCVLRQEGWYPEHPQQLRTPLGLPFGDVVGVFPMSLRLDPAPMLTLQVQGATLFTVPLAGEVPVHLRESRTFGEIVTVDHYTQLRWSAVAGKLLVALPRDERVQFEAGVVTAVQVACADIALESEPLRGSERRCDQSISALRPISISASPGGPVIARVQLPAGTAAFIRQKDAWRSQVAFHLPDGPLADAQFEGWVESNCLSLHCAHAARLPSAMTSWRGPVMSDSHGCSREHELWVDAGAGPEVVGKVLPRTKLLNLRKRFEFTEVSILGRAVREARSRLSTKPGVHVLVSDAAAADCE
jgi:hypothetical protein